MLIPFTHFNRNKDKLFFFTGYQYLLSGARHRPVARDCAHGR